MGWGEFSFMTDEDRDPKEMLLPYHISGESATVVIDYQYPEPADVYAYGYELESDCGITIYCSECGVAMCPGCGDRPFLIITLEEGGEAYCLKTDCRGVLRKRLRKLWPTVHFSPRF